MIQVMTAGGLWAYGQPINGQRYRIVENGVVILESYWYQEE